MFSLQLSFDLDLDFQKVVAAVQLSRACTHECTDEWTHSHSLAELLKSACQLAVPLDVSIGKILSAITTRCAFIGGNPVILDHDESLCDCSRHLREICKPSSILRRSSLPPCRKLFVLHSHLLSKCLFHLAVPVVLRKPFSSNCFVPDEVIAPSGGNPCLKLQIMLNPPLELLRFSFTLRCCTS